MFESMKNYKTTYNVEVSKVIPREEKAISLKELSGQADTGFIRGYRSGSSRGYDYCFMLVQVGEYVKWVSLPKSYKPKFEGLTDEEVQAMVDGKVQYTNLKSDREYMGHPVFTFDFIVVA